ncbi:MAG: CBS domain-containing protein [Candidatus Omnitrophica bacterium]|jgi:CBS domain-containing protein/sporulation protein YlmC with PRC-barrel domain|nr:CBS domain-containing protein [Candidatus Omnitrophota bacterium]MDD5252816.1 CBS domain-containing protein [Candidatus Omnitrophota bacterium]
MNLFNQNFQKNISAAKMFIFFSRLMDKPVFDKEGRGVGEIYDIIVKPSQVYPISDGLIIRKGFPNRKYAMIAWQDIERLDKNGAKLKIGKSQLVFNQIHDEKKELTLRRDILDQQVVDTYNHKVIRVNDIQLLTVEQALMIAHVDISTRGLFRRLGFEKSVDLTVRLFNPKAKYLSDERLISWKYIQPLTINPVSMTIKIDVPQRNLANIPAADLGDIFLDLNINHQIALFKSLNLANKTKIFTNVDFKTQRSILNEMSDLEISELLNNIPSDEATDFLEKLPSEKTKHILSLIENKYSKRLSQLLGYSGDSAGGLMTTEYIAFAKETTVQSALEQIRVLKFKSEPAQFIYIVDETSHLISATNFRRLILANPQEPISNSAFPKTYFVHLDSSVKEVAYLMEKYKYFAIPVVNEDHVLQGIITADDILSQLIAFAWRRLKKIKIIQKT